MAQKTDDRRQVLVVDDHPDTLELLCELLRINGYTVWAHQIRMQRSREYGSGCQICS